MDYTEEQKEDIKARSAKAETALRDLQVQPASWVTPHNVGDDVFGLKVTSYLQDTKYAPVKSPIHVEKN